MVYTDIHLPLPGFIALDWTLMSLALIPILLRFSLRLSQRWRPTGPHPFATNTSDFFVVLAWLSGLVLIIINTWKNTLRQHYIHSSPSTLYYGVPKPLAGHLLHVSWISLFFIYISLWSSKAAFLAFYYSVFAFQGRRTKIVLVAASAFTLATFLLHMFLIAFWCSPISLNWNTNGHLCSAVHNINSVTLSTFTNIATDLVILSIPVFSLFPTTSTINLTRMGKVERTGLAMVFLIGSVSVLAALARFVVLKLVEHVPRAEITHTIDVWALVEIVSSLVAVCLPSLRCFVRRHRGMRLGSASGCGIESGSGSESACGSGSFVSCERKPGGRQGLEDEWVRRDEEGKVLREALYEPVVEVKHGA